MSPNLSARLRLLAAFALTGACAQGAPNCTGPGTVTCVESGEPCSDLATMWPQAMEGVVAPQLRVCSQGLYCEPTSSKCAPWPTPAQQREAWMEHYGKECDPKAKLPCGNMPLKPAGADDFYRQVDLSFLLIRDCFTWALSGVPWHLYTR